MSERFDLVLVGGGLANTLIAWRLAMTRPELRFCLIESGPSLGANHTWSFHDTDLTADQLAWIEPFVVHRWPDQEVRFPGYRRILKIGYRSIASDHLHRTAAEALGERAILNAAVTTITADGVDLADGRHIDAGAVVDGRGAANSAALSLGFQKFVGREVVTETPHGIERPVIMDASIDQHDGYRFVYLLPFAPNRLLIEDTYYSDTADLDGATISARITAYAAANEWRIARTIREERGILPIALAGDIAAMWREGPPGVARTGLRAGLFHPTTGYSLPDAVRLADRIANAPSFAGPDIASLTYEHAETAWRNRGFFRFLNRMLFMAARPGQRYRLLERFYRLPEGLVARFYADRLTVADRIRILAGRPPVPVARALACLTDASGRRASRLTAAAEVQP